MGFFEALAALWSMNVFKLFFALIVGKFMVLIKLWPLWLFIFVVWFVGAFFNKW